MSHVADGELHAYLDGALDLYPDEEAHRIRSHLETCAECRRRLEEEEPVRDRSAAVLARTGPRSVDVPSFESIRRRAASGSAASDGSAGSGRSGLATRLGWAASVLVALGVGWMVGREPVGRSTSAGSPSVSAEIGSLRDADTPPAAVRAPEARVARMRAEPVTPVTEEEDVAGRSGDVAESEPTVAAEQEIRVAADPLTSVPFPLLTPDSVRAAMAEDFAARARSMGRPDSTAVLRDSIATAQTRAEARSRVDGIPVAAEAARRRAVPGEVPVEGLVVERERRAAEARRDATALILPGLEVVEVEWTEVAPDVEGLLVVQRLVGDTTRLELRFGGLARDSRDSGDAAPRTERASDVPASTGYVGPPAALLGETLPDGVSQVNAPLPGGGWVVLRGRLAPGRLQRLLDLLR